MKPITYINPPTREDRNEAIARMLGYKTEREHARQGSEVVPAHLLDSFYMPHSFSTWVTRENLQYDVDWRELMKAVDFIRFLHKDKPWQEYRAGEYRLEDFSLGLRQINLLGLLRSLDGWRSFAFTQAHFARQSHRGETNSYIKAVWLVISDFALFYVQNNDTNRN